MVRLRQTGRIEETIRFGPAGASLTYALQHADDAQQIALHYDAKELTVTVPHGSVRRWADSSEVGIYASIGTGQGALEVSIEKDFACLDKDDTANADTFPNPHQGAIC